MGTAHPLPIVPRPTAFQRGPAGLPLTVLPGDVVQLTTPDGDVAHITAARAGSLTDADVQALLAEYGDTLERAPIPRPGPRPAPDARASLHDLAAQLRMRGLRASMGGGLCGADDVAMLAARPSAALHRAGSCVAPTPRRWFHDEDAPAARAARARLNRLIARRRLQRMQGRKRAARDAALAAAGAFTLGVALRTAAILGGGLFALAVAGALA